MLPDRYQGLLNLPSSQIVVLGDDDPPPLHEMELGVLFILAVWSATSYYSFRTLASVLNSIPLPPGFRLYILDVESPFVDRVYTAAGEQGGGNGETYWMLDGSVVHKLTKYRHEAAPQVEEFTRRIFARARE